MLEQKFRDTLFDVLHRTVEETQTGGIVRELAVLLQDPRLGDFNALCTDSALLSPELWPLYVTLITTLL